MIYSPTIIKRIRRLTGLLRTLYGGQQASWWGLVTLGFVSGLLEGLGVSALIPLFSFVTGGQGLSPDFVTRFFHKFFDVFNLPYNIWTILLFIPTLFILKAFVLLWYSQWKARIAASYEKRYRVNLYQDLLEANWSFLAKQRLGHLENTLMTDMGFTVILLDNLLELVRISSNFLVFFGLALVISWPLTIVAAVCGSTILLIFRPILLRSRLYARYKGNLNKRIAHYINEQVVGLKTIKSLSVVEPLTAIAGRFFEEVRHLRVRQALVKNLTKLFIEPLLVILVVIIFAISYRGAAFSLGVFITVIYLIQQIFGQVDKAQRFIHTVFESAAYATNVLVLKAEAKKHQENVRSGQPFKFNQFLEFENVSFAYPDNQLVTKNDKVLREINFQIKRGEILAIVGPSGVGKTTIVDLLLRLLAPTAGQILLDGRPIGEIDLAGWRRAVSYVPQEPFLVNDTIENNIRFYDQAVPAEKIWEAIHSANIDDFANRLPQGIEKTVVGERGTSLSGGERQRVVLARALAREPKILVLDEATSALDAGSEKAIIQVLANLRGRLTVIIITHRPALAQIADRVLTLEAGTIHG